MSDMNTGPMEPMRNDREELGALDRERTKQDKKYDKEVQKLDTKTEGDGLNKDPITGAPGAHPVGTGLGAGSGAAAGAVGGALVGGPIGFVAGGVVGAVVGGLAGKGVAEKVDPTVEDKYWRENYSKRSYAKPEMKYEQLQPAYKYGWEAREKNAGKQWNDVESNLQAGWKQDQQGESLSWDDAKPATKDAWDRLDVNKEEDGQGDGVK